MIMITVAYSFSLQPLRSVVSPDLSGEHVTTYNRSIRCDCPEKSVCPVSIILAML